ncbi:MAG: undecaprenyl-phosphate glucose phosphotransferase [Clostridia bacterium]
MIRSIQKYLNFLNRILDVCLIVGAYYLATLIWLFVLQENAYNLARTMRTAWMVALVYAAVAVLTYQIIGLYDSLRARPIGREVVCVLEANGLSVVIVAAILYVLRLQEFSRGVLMLFYALSCAFILAKRLLMRYTLHHFRKLGYNQKHIILIGDGTLAEQYRQSIQNNPQFGYNIVGYIGQENRLSGTCCLGGLSRLTELITGAGVDEVVAALEPTDVSSLPDIIMAAEKQGTKVSIIPFYNNYIPASAKIEVVGESKLINVRTTPLDNLLNNGIKRFGDILGAFILIVLSSPLMLIAAIGTKLSGSGPIIFRQERVGLNKKTFIMYKFRSMCVNAVQDTAWTKSNDPRKTRFGSFIRKTSLDELPQFFNVLKGDMSLVGPRPEIPHFVEQFRETIPLYMVKHRVRPGITGWAQVCGYRGDTSIEERIRCDIWYIENWTVWLDIRICFLTVFGGMINKEKLHAKETK